MEAESRFWSKVDRSGGADACWEWAGRRDQRGYGKFKLNGGDHRTNRMAWGFSVGPVPHGKFVLHECDNPACCNPSHLFLGTQLDNMRDMAAKGRNGAMHSAVSDQLCREVRLCRENSGMGYGEIAKLYGLQKHNVVGVCRPKPTRKSRSTGKRRGKQRVLGDLQRVEIQLLKEHSGMLDREIALLFGVSRSLVNGIVTSK